ncbi:MAG: hypothetical protein SF187_26110 [Deltaproteobacteria bacterium]|nr:hypothetical protein [Deltaproteobacteria bacterium]
MSNATSTKPGTLLPPEADPRALEVQANRIIDDSRAALSLARNEADDVAQRLVALKSVCDHIEAMAAQLTTATFRASGEATKGTSARAVIVSFVEELGNMAKQAATVARELRGALGTRPYIASTVEANCRVSETALGDLSRIVRQLTEKADRPVARTIQVENRAVRARGFTSADLLDDDDATADAAPWSLGRSRSSGYKN